MTTTSNIQPGGCYHESFPNGRPPRGSPGYLVWVIVALTVVAMLGFVIIRR